MLALLVICGLIILYLQQVEFVVTCLAVVGVDLCDIRTVSSWLILALDSSSTTESCRLLIPKHRCVRRESIANSELDHDGL
jgi:hypothetical protein